MRLSPGRAILYGTIVVGSLDAIDAIVFFGLRGVRPIRIFHSIAAGLLGRSAFQGGLATALLGAFLHFFIALTIVINGTVKVLDFGLAKALGTGTAEAAPYDRDSANSGRPVC